MATAAATAIYNDTWAGDVAALSIFLYGMGLVALAMDEPPHSAIVRHAERN